MSEVAAGTLIDGKCRHDKLPRGGRSGPEVGLAILKNIWTLKVNFLETLRRDSKVANLPLEVSEQKREQQAAMEGNWLPDKSARNGNNFAILYPHHPELLAKPSNVARVVPCHSVTIVTC